MAQPAPVPSAHSVRVFGGDGFLVKYFVSAKSAKRFEHSRHCSFKSFFFFNIYILRQLLLSSCLNKYKITVAEIIKPKSFSVQKAG